MTFLYWTFLYWTYQWVNNSLQCQKWGRYWLDGYSPRLIVAYRYHCFQWKKGKDTIFRDNHCGIQMDVNTYSQNNDCLSFPEKSLHRFHGRRKLVHTAGFHWFVSGSSQSRISLRWDECFPAKNCIRLTSALLFFFPERMLLPHHQLLAVSKLRINAKWMNRRWRPRTTRARSKVRRCFRC